MKPLVFFLIGLCFYSSTFSQEPQATKLRAYEYAFCTGNSLPSNPDWTETNILVVVRYEEHKVAVYSKKQQDFDIIKYYSKKEDPNGDSYFRQDAVDQDGKECQVNFYLYDKPTNSNKGILFIKYPGYSLLYRLKTTE